MMNDETEKFEQRLTRQPLRPIPREWRAEVLAAALSAARPAPRASLLETLNQQLATLFWPHPKAWACLASVWVFILTVNLSMHDSSPRRAEKSEPPSPEMMVELRKQQLLLAELISPRESHDADRPRNFTPRPRGERVEILTT